MTPFGYDRHDPHRSDFVTQSLAVATYNIHKGFSHFNRRMIMHHLRDRLRVLGSDVLFLQEVVGHNARHAINHEHWPEQPQHEFLADSVWSDFAYGKNAVYREGHHGNAILSRYPIVKWDNLDISTNPVEQRGMLHAEIAVPGWKENLHCVCVHLGLFAPGRRRQVASICERIKTLVPHGAPLVIAGDFNDWRAKASEALNALGVHEVFETAHGRIARTFPARMPILTLDRIYVRGLEVKSTKIHHGLGWSKLSDHAALAAHLALI